MLKFLYCNYSLFVVVQLRLSSFAYPKRSTIMNSFRISDVARLTQISAGMPVDWCKIKCSTTMVSPVIETFGSNPTWVTRTIGRQRQTALAGNIWHTCICTRNWAPTIRQYSDRKVKKVDKGFPYELTEQNTAFRIKTSGIFSPATERTPFCTKKWNALKNEYFSTIAADQHNG